MSREVRAFVVKRGFGRLTPGYERRLGEHTYIRMYSHGEETLLEYSSSVAGVEGRLRVASDGVDIVPAPPVLAEPRVSSMLMLKLDEPLVIDSGRRVELRVCLPVDIVAALGGSMLFALPSTRVKYSLYGSIDKGLVARVVRDSTPPCAEARISLVNAGGAPVRVTRIVFPGYMLSLCYIPGKERVYANQLLVTILDDLGYVQPGRLDSPPGCIEAPRFLKAPIFEKQKFIMLYGF